MAGGNDLWLAKKIWDKDADAAFEVVSRYGNTMLKSAYLMLGDYHEAEDVVQEAIWLIIKKPEIYKENGDLEAFLVTIAINLARDRLRSFWKKRVYPKEHLPKSRFSVSTSAEEVAVDKIHRESMVGILEKLSVDYRAVIILYYYQDLSVKEISTLMNWPEGTVKSKLHRGRKILRKEIEKGGISYGVNRTEI